MSDSQRGLRFVGCLFVCLCVSLAYTVGFGAYRLWNVQSNRSASFEVFWEAWNNVEQYFYSEVPSAQVRTYGAIRGALQSLGDPYTVFVEPQPRELERDQMQGAYGGIGVELWRDAEGQLSLSPYPDSPAEQAGVVEGDLLLKVDGERVDDTSSVDDVRAMIHGEVGARVTLTLSRPPTPPFDLTITRDEIQTPSVTWRVLDQAPEVGYIRITSFTGRTNDEVLVALRELQQAGTTGLILDLRDNYGGLIEPAVAATSQFLRDGVVLYERWRGEEQDRVFRVRSGGIALDTPLAVLVNRGTASAAEIVAAALQDRDRAPLIGEATYGKGSVQLIYDLSDGSSVHVTAAIWLTPDKHRIDGLGLTPDIEAERGDGSLDKQIESAVDYIQSQ